jgi:hypothetical protein
MNTTFYTSPEFFQPEQTLRFKLKYLLLTHTVQEVHTTLRNIFEEDYLFYQLLFAPLPQAPPAPPPAPAPIPQPDVAVLPQETTLRPPKSRPDMKIRIVKKSAPEVIPEATPAEVSSDKEKKAQIKKELAEKIAEKHAQLVASGIDPSSLLTKANLKKWLETDLLAYTDIARDHVGLPTDQIASIAKGYGFQSPFSLKRKAMIFSK